MDSAKASLDDRSPERDYQARCYSQMAPLHAIPVERSREGFMRIVSHVRDAKAATAWVHANDPAIEEHQANMIQFLHLQQSIDNMQHHYRLYPVNILGQVIYASRRSYAICLSSNACTDISFKQEHDVI